VVVVAADQEEGGRLTVAYVGGDPQIDPGPRVQLRESDAERRGRAGEAATAEALPAAAEGADCIVVEASDRALESAAVAAETDVPTVVYDPAGDAVVAARATRLGVDEYVTDEALGEETLVDRLVAVARGESGPGASLAADERRQDAALEALHDVATDRTLDLEEKIRRLLDVGRKRLGLDIGFLSSVDGDEYTVEVVSGTHPVVEGGRTVPLSETYCRRTVAADGPVGFHDAGATGNDDDPGYELSGLRCYLGGRVVVDDELYGTLCFASDTPRAEPFSESERRFLELLVAWLSYEIERTDREQSLRRYRAVHETVEGMVLVVGEGAELELVTQPLADRFGYDREQLLATPLAEFLGDDLVMKGYEALERLQAGAESVTVESTVEAADGTPVPVEVELSLLSSQSEFEGLVGIVRDRTELTQTRAELEAERDRFQQLFDRLPDAVAEITVDNEPLVRSVNPTFEAVFGRDSDTLVGQPAESLPKPERLGEARAPGEGEYDTHEAELETSDGLRTFLFRRFTYRADDGTRRGFYIYTDVTERVEQKRRLRVLHRVLRHNLRNETTTLNGYVDLLSGVADEHGLEAPEFDEYVERIQEGTEGIAELGQQVERIEAALDRERSREAVDPESVVRRIADRFRADHPGATVRVSGDPEAGVVADELLDLAVENLLENAIEHAGPEPSVTVTLEADGEWVDVTVADDGPGIPERERAVVGGDREITQLDHSRGLGLWVSKWVVEGVGGQLRFEEPAEGAAVTLRLQRVAE
jgi:PAS domain S-box-containing protein